MISKEIEQALNEQLHEEFFSFYLYLSMAAHFESGHLEGLARWMRLQAEEEMTHAMKFLDFILERGGSPALEALARPTHEWPSPGAVFEAALKHEQHITARINALMDKAVGERDHATATFLQWFVKEQVEEEAALEPIVHRMRLFSDHLGALYQLDHQLGKRGK